MINFVSGKVRAIEGNLVVVELPGAGIGLSVSVSAAALSGIFIGENCQLKTEFIVREDGWQLFGFSSEEERIWFRQLHGISGIGPKTAMATLSVLGVAGLAAAISDGDEAALVSVPGLGKKSAGRIVLELRDKVLVTGSGGSHSDVVAALVNLGWSEKTAREAVAELDGSGLDTSALLREALKRLAKS